MDIEEFKKHVSFKRKQGDRFMLSLAYMIRFAKNGFERFGRLTLENGHCVYASFRKEDIIRTCGSPDIHSYAFKDSEHILYVNITEGVEAKEKLLRIVGRQLGHPAHVVCQLISVVREPVIDLGI